MKKLLFIFSILLIISDGLFGQAEINNAYLKFKVVKGRDKEYFSKVSGSMYENSDFNEALVYTLGHSTPQKARLRYNNCFDEMEMVPQGNEDPIFLDKRNLIDSLILNNELYRYMNYQDKGKNLSGYFIRLCSGECNLFTKRLREINDERIPASGYEEYIPPTISDMPVLFFVQINKEPLELLPNTSKKIVNYFQQKGYDLTELLKSEKIKNDDESLQKIVNFCNIQGRRNLEK